MTTRERPRRSVLLRLRRSDQGMSLVELSVTMLLLGFILSAVFGIVMATRSNVSSTSQRLNQVNAARVSINAITRDLRTAVLPTQLGATCPDGAPTTDPRCTKAAFILADSSSMQFYANVDNPNNTVGPSRVTYAVSAAGDLTEQVQPPDTHAADNFNFTWCAAVTPPTVACPARYRVLARGVQTSTALFTYYDAAGTAITSRPLTAADLQRVDSIDVVVKIKQSPSAKVAATTVVQRVALPNADSVVQTDPTN